MSLSETTGVDPEQFMTAEAAFARVRNCNGTVRPYKQVFFQWHEGNPGDRSGACFGLSLLWIRETKRGKSFLDAVGDDIESPVSSEAHMQVLRNPGLPGTTDTIQQIKTFRKQVATRYAAGHITKYLNSVTRGEAGGTNLNINEARLKQNEMLAQWQITPLHDGDKLATKKISGGDFQFSSGGDLKKEEVYPIVIEKTAEAITEHRNCWVLVHRKDHTMAARVGNDGNVLFFDPNGGEVNLPTPADFKKWFTEFWGEIDAYKDSYQFILEYYNV